MASGTMISRMLGFVKAILLVEAIGQTKSISADAFSNGNFLPNALYMLLLGGMLNAVLVPQIVKATKGKDGGAGYINKVLTLVIVVLSLVTLVAMLFAPSIVWVFAVTWPPEQLALATAFAYWCLPQIIFYGLYTVLGEVLNARERFGPFTWAPVLNNVIGIAGILAFIFVFGTDPNGYRTVEDWTQGAIALLAGSGTLGVVVQSLILFVSWRRAGIRFRPDFKWRGMGIGQTMRIASWSLATIIVMNLGGIVTTNVAASASGEGPSSLALQNAWLIFMLPHSVLAVSIGTAYFTSLATAGQLGDKARYRRDFSSSARLITLVMLFAAAAVFAAAPYVSRVMQPTAEVELVNQFSLVLRTYVIGLAAYSLLFVVQRAFYALSDTRTPFLFTSGQIVLFALGSLACMGLPASVRGAGVAFVFSLTTILQVLAALWLLRRKIGRIDGFRLRASFVRSIPAGVAAAGVGTALTSWVVSVNPDFGMLYAVVVACGTAGVVGVVYFVILRLLKSDELSNLTNWVRVKLRR